MATVLGGFGIGVVLAYEIYSIDTFIELNHVAVCMLIMIFACAY